MGHDVQYYYPVANGVVEVSQARVVSWGAATVWKLRAFPQDPDPSVFLDDSVAKYLANGTRFVHVSILNRNGTTHTEFVTKSREILYAIWINTEDTEEEAANEPSMLSEGADY